MLATSRCRDNNMGRSLPDVSLCRDHARYKDPLDPEAFFNHVSRRSGEPRKQRVIRVITQHTAAARVETKPPSRDTGAGSLRRIAVAATKRVSSLGG
jgi:hypothetical protein